MIDADTRRRDSELVYIPKSTKALGLLTLILFFVTITMVVLAVSQGLVGPPGVPGQKGDAGIQGPRGPAGSLDAATLARIATLESQLRDTQEMASRVVRMRWFNKRRDQFNSQITTYLSATNERLSSFVTLAPKPCSSYKPIGAMPQETDPISGSETVIKTMAREDFSETLDLDKHPNFDNNHFYDVPHADEIKCGFQQEEYRRLWDQYNTARLVILRVKSEYDNEVNKTDGELSSLFQNKH
jgi:hypothetical protein